MDFTILISIYKNDCADQLHEALCSIYDIQVIKPKQIILVEDGELTPDIYTILDFWTRRLPNILERVSLIENVGLGNALNEGLRYCSNEWIFRMDADDICAADRFSKQVDFIRNNPDIDILSGYIEEFVDLPEKPTRIKKVPLLHEEILQFARWRSPFNHVTVAYKKSVIEAVGGYQHHLLMEDYNLWLRVLAAGYKGANLSDILVYVRTGNSMIMRRHGWRYVKSEWKLFKLKRELNFQTILPAFICFLLRSLPRLLPSEILSLIYRAMRK